MVAVFRTAPGQVCRFKARRAPTEEKREKGPVAN